MASLASQAVGGINSLIEMAKQKDAENRDMLFEKAKQKCLEAESIKVGSGAYNLACACALLEEESECKKWLEICERSGTLPEDLSD